MNKSYEDLELEIRILERELDEIYGTLSLAHLELIHSIKYGFNPGTAHSQLISVGKHYPKLKQRMDIMLKEKHARN
jgi:hypothetical protein